MKGTLHLNMTPEERLALKLRLEVVQWRERRADEHRTDLRTFSTFPPMRRQRTYRRGD